MKASVKSLRHAGRFPSYNIFVVLPDTISEADAELLVQELKRSREPANQGIARFEDSQLKVPKKGDIAISLKFKYNWVAKTDDYRAFYGKRVQGNVEDPKFLETVKQIQDRLFNEGPGLDLTVYRSGLVIEGLRVPVIVKNEPKYREAFSFATLAPVWTLLLTPLSRLVENQMETGQVNFPRILMKDKVLFPWGDGFSKAEALTKALYDYTDVITSIEERAVADKSFDKITEARCMCIVFRERALQIAEHFKLKNHSSMANFSFKIMELECESMNALHSTLVSMEEKLNKLVDEFKVRK